MKVSELTGVQLDWAVAKCEGYLDDCNSWLYEATLEEVEKNPYHPSTIWAQGGPIVEREGINVGRHEWMGPSMEVISWSAERYATEKPGKQIGPTPLIAAMRCYVASKLGDDVEILKGLMT